MANIFIKTYGCTANQDNEAIISGLLIETEHNLTNNQKEADIIIINTCTVKGVTENKILSELRTIKKQKLIITGCMAGAQENLLKKEFPDASIISTQNITKIPEAVNKLMNNETITLTKKNKEVKANLPKLIKGKICAVQISEGCTENCTFCITKLAKGYLFSFPENEIIEEIKKRLKQGVTTFYITSQDNSAYGLDKHKTSQLPNLLKKITELEGNFKIRNGMSNPKHILPVLEELIEVYKNPKVIKFLHIPIQSGSNKVLKEMNRKSTVEEFKHIITEFKKAIPDITISTDIIVGYPTETEEDFKETVNLVKEMNFNIINLSKFASRPGTIASKLKKLPTQEIKARSVSIDKIYKSQKKK